MSDGSDKGKRRTRKPAAKRAPRDIAFLHGPTEDGEGARLVRLKEGNLSAGELRPAREGEDLQSHELVRLKPLSARFPVCEIETLHAPEPARQTSGPARVSNETYRKNWGVVFGGKKKPAKDYTVN